jgi:hypothetical protein
MSTPDFLARFWLKLNFLGIFSKNIQISNFMTMRPKEPDFHVDGWTDRKKKRDGDRKTDRHDEANSRFSQFCESAYKPGLNSLCIT